MTNSNVALEKYYAEMNEREQANRASEVTQERERTLSRDRAQHVDGVNDAYLDAKEGQGVTVHQALGAIAGYFYDPNTNMKPRGDESEANGLGFQQRGALGNMCQNAKWMMDNAIQHKLKLEAEVDQLEAICDDSEISLNKLSFAIDKLEDCLTVQIPATEEWLELTKAAYEAVVGDKWTPFTKAGPSAAKQTADSVRARMERLRNK